MWGEGVFLSTCDPEGLSAWLSMAAWLSFYPFVCLSLTFVLS